MSEALLLENIVEKLNNDEKVRLTLKTIGAVTRSELAVFVDEVLSLLNSNAQMGAWVDSVAVYDGYLLFVE